MMLFLKIDWVYLIEKMLPTTKIELYSIMPQLQRTFVYITTAKNDVSWYLLK